MSWKVKFSFGEGGGGGGGRMGDSAPSFWIFWFRAWLYYHNFGILEIETNSVRCEKRRFDMWTGAIIGEGDRKSWDPCGRMIWDNFLFLDLRHPDVIYSHCSTNVGWVLACMLSRCMIKNGESCEILFGFFTARAGNKAGKKNQGSSMHFYALS